MRNDKGEQRQRLLYEGEQYGSTDCKPADAHEPEGRATPDGMQRATHNTVTPGYSGVDLVVGTAPERVQKGLHECHDPNAENPPNHTQQPTEAHAGEGRTCSAGFRGPTLKAACTRQTDSKSSEQGGARAALELFPRGKHNWRAIICSRPPGQGARWARACRNSQVQDFNNETQG